MRLKNESQPLVGLDGIAKDVRSAIGWVGHEELEGVTPTRVVLSGPPGGGKTTLIWQALRQHRNALEKKNKTLDVYYVGRSRFDDVKQVSLLLKALVCHCKSTTAIIFLEEADGIVARRMKNVTNLLKELLQDHTRVCIVCTMNSTDLIDEAVLSRFVHMKVPLPHADARAQIVRREFERFNSDLVPIIEAILGRIVDSTEGWNARKLQQTCSRAIQAAAMNEDHTIRSMNNDRLLSELERLFECSDQPAKQYPPKVTVSPFLVMPLESTQPQNANPLFAA